MKRILRTVSSFLVISLFSISAFAEVENTSVNTSDETEISSDETEATRKDKKKKDKKKKEKKQLNLGTLSGSFETNTIGYVDDKAAGVSAPKNNYGSNNYLKLDYRISKFSAGVQAEYYPQVVQGYEKLLNGFALPTKYVAWTDKYFSVTVGDFYEQFGSGLLFRAWEDRMLGHNNSIGGARVTFNILDYVQGKLIYGVPRYYMGTTRGNGVQVPTRGDFFNTYSTTQILGGDLSFDISKMSGIDQLGHRLTLEGSVLTRFEKGIPSDINALLLDDAGNKTLDLNKNNTSYSARVNYEYGGFGFKAEYVGKEKDIFQNPKTHEWELRAGNAQIVELNYSGYGLSVMGAFRRIDNMQNRIFRGGSFYPANTLNYIPAMSPQHSYSLATINPFSPHIEGEIGGQLDVFYNFKRGTVLGGKRGWKIHGNYSQFFSLEKSNAQAFSPFLYRDITVDAEKYWTKKFKTVLFMSIQELAVDGGKGTDGRTEAKNVFVLDMTYKFTRKFSMRGEFQYLYSQEGVRGQEKGKGDWVAGLLEFNIAPNWSIYVSDMYNHGGDKLHYYNAGASFTYSVLRVSASYGRNREGYVCSGGVCRYQPAYTGGNILLSVIF